MPYYELAIGRPYDPTRSHYPQTEQLRVSDTICELVRFWPSPTWDEITQHQHGEATFALVDEAPDLLLLAHRFGSLEWSDTPFQAHRMTSAPTGVPDVAPGESLTLTTVLVDSETGIIRALRLDALSSAFSTALAEAVAAQLAAPFDDRAAALKQRRLYDRYATPEEMVRGRADVVSRG